MRRIPFLLAGGLLAACSTLCAQSSIDETQITQTITVDPNGSGPNNYTTLSAAEAYLNNNRAANIKVSIAAGTYREGDIYLNDRTGVTVIEGSAPGEVIITGADIWTGWTHDGSGNYSKPWTEDWGLATYDPEFFDIQDDLGKRAEMVSVDDTALLQVTAKADLVDDSFTVDETNDLIWIRLAGGADPDSGSTVEVSTRHLCLFFYKTNNLVLRNLVIENYANSNQFGNGSYTVALFGESASNRAQHLLIEDCTFTGNNSGGITLTQFENITLRDSVFTDNGGGGAGMSRFNYALIEGCEYSANNWRIGGYGGFSGWAPAGTKLLLFGNTTIRNCSFLDNIATGLWLDTGAENVHVYDCIASDNVGGPGIYVEASYGPVSIDNCLIQNNGLEDTSEGLNQGGILIAESRDVTITNNTIEDNHHGQIMIRTRDRPEAQAGYLSQTSFDGYVEDITIRRNRIKGKDLINTTAPEPYWLSLSSRGSSLIMMTTHGKTSEYQAQFLPTLDIDNNSYWHEDRTAVFSEGGDYGFDRVNLADWQEIYGNDVHSVWEATAWETLQQNLEAEDGNPQSPYATVVDASASGDAYVEIPNTGTNYFNAPPATATGQLVYNFDIFEEREYIVEALMIAPNGNDDSCWVRVNDGDWIMWNSIASSQAWQWDQLHDTAQSGARVKFLLDPGMHTLEIHYREDGLSIDRVRVTSDASLVADASVLVDATIHGSLEGTAADQNDTIYNLSTAGYTDWSTFGNSTSIMQVGKAGASDISNYTVIGTPSVLRKTYSNSTWDSFTWTDGDAVSSATNLTTAINVQGEIGGGIEVTVPADASITRRVTVWVSSWGASSELKASLSDGSESDIIYEIVGGSKQFQRKKIVFEYRSATDGETLKISHIATAWSQAQAGNVKINAIALEEL